MLSKGLPIVLRRTGKPLGNVVTDCGLSKPFWTISKLRRQRLIAPDTRERDSDWSRIQIG
jgi:hypothetical protein